MTQRSRNQAIRYVKDSEFSSRDRSYANSGGAIDFPDAPDTLGNLEKVDHPRIKTIASYLNAGWNNAQDGTWLRPRQMLSYIKSLIHFLNHGVYAFSMLGDH